MMRLSEDRVTAEKQPGKRIDEFKRHTLGKLHGLRCPQHRQGPQVHFEGATLQTLTIRMSACCDALIALANQKIAGQ